MPENPYVAPAAYVEDAAPLPKGPRPRVVEIAVRLLWLSFGLSVIPLGVDIAGMPAGETSTVVVALVYLALIGLGAYLNVCTARGRNWARVVLLVFAAVILVAWPFVPQDADGSTFEWWLGVVSIALDTAAMGLLFARSAHPWFR